MRPFGAGPWTPAGTRVRVNAWVLVRARCHRKWNATGNGPGVRCWYTSHANIKTVMPLRPLRCLIFSVFLHVSLDENPYSGGAYLELVFIIRRNKKTNHSIPIPNTTEPSVGSRNALIASNQVAIICHNFELPFRANSGGRCCLAPLLKDDILPIRDRTFRACC